MHNRNNLEIGGAAAEAECETAPGNARAELPLLHEPEERAGEKSSRMAPESARSAHTPMSVPQDTADHDIMPAATIGWPEAEAWFCLRTLPKHEHIAAAQLGQDAGVEVF